MKVHAPAGEQTQQHAQQKAQPVSQRVHAEAESVFENNRPDVAMLQRFQTAAADSSRLTQLKSMQTMMAASPRVQQLQSIQRMIAGSTAVTAQQHMASTNEDVMGGGVSEVAQRVDSDDSDDSDEDYEEEDNEAPDGYMSPSDYYEEYRGTDHSELDDDVWVANIDNWPALWWKNPEQQTDLRLRGTRALDVAALGGDDGGFTWHHCADYGGGTCTMQQVDTAQHGSWGHRGGAAQAGYAEAD